MNEVTGGEPEKNGKFPNPRAYFSGRDLWEHPGTHVHGDEDDFNHRSSFTKYAPDGLPGFDPCNGIEIGWNLIALGVRFDDLIPAPTIFKAGLRLGALLIEPREEFSAGLALGGIIEDIEEELVAGLALGGIIESVPPATEELVAGLALGGILVGVPAVPEAFVAGLALGGIVEDIEEPMEVFLSGLALGAIVEDVPPAPEAFVAGLKLGATLSDVPPTPEAFVAGLKLGGILADVPFPPDGTPTEVFKAGLKLGMIGHDLESEEASTEGLALGAILEDVADELVPGETCGDAPELAMDTDYTFDIASGPGSHWFKFPGTSGTQYHVTITLNSGSGFSAAVTTGTCASPTFRFALNTLTTCDSYTPGSDTTFMVQVSPGLMGTSNYTINAGTGACP